MQIYYFIDIIYKTSDKTNINFPNSLLVFLLLILFIIYIICEYTSYLN